MDQSATRVVTRESDPATIQSRRIGGSLQASAPLRLRESAKGDLRFKRNVWGAALAVSFLWWIGVAALLRWLL